MTYIAVLIATLVIIAFGFLWYSGALFGKQWMQLSGQSPEKLAAIKARGMRKIFGINFISTLITAFVIYRFIDLLQITSVVGACEFVLWVWLGFIIPIELGQVLWAGKPWKLFVLNSLQRLGGYLLGAIVLVLIG